MPLSLICINYLVKRLNRYPQSCCTNSKKFIHSNSVKEQEKLPIELHTIFKGTVKVLLLCDWTVILDLRVLLLKYREKQ